MEEAKPKLAKKTGRARKAPTGRVMPAAQADQRNAMINPLEILAQAALANDENQPPVAEGSTVLFLLTVIAST
jgi:hypothetical protein